MRTSRSWIAVAPLLLLAAGVAPARAVTTATAQLRADIDRVFRALDDAAARDASPAARREALRPLTRDMFAWTEMARHALGPHWAARTARERAEFIGHLGELVTAQVAGLETFRDVPIAYLGETVQGEQALVRTEVRRGAGRTLALDYRLVHGGDRWRVVDVIVDRVSLVDGYRAQFQRVIRTASYQGLLEKLAAP